LALYPEEVISDVCMANDIVDVVSGYVTLKKSSGGFVGLCPFHNEKTPSFHVSPAKQLYHCFGCGEGGTVINFIMKIENLDFVETVKLLADRAGITLPEEKIVPGDKNHEKRKLYYEMNKEVARHFYQNLSKTSFGTDVLTYMQCRGLQKSTIVKFGLGASGGNATDLYQMLSKKGYALTDMVGAGLVMKNEKGVYDRFRGRMMFPIFDLRSNVIGFGGRVLGDGVPKYLNSPETLVFNKGKNIFAMNIAKNYIRDSLILVEGYMDVISLHQHGIMTAVASLGTALTEEQAKLMARYAKKVYICYDSDEAGRKATLKAIEVFRGTSAKCMICDFAGAKDPDELILRKGKDAFLKLLKEARSPAMYQIDLAKTHYNLDEVEEKISFVKECADILAKIQDSIEIEAYTKMVCDYCGLSQDSVFREIRKNSAKNNRNPVNRYYKENIVYNKNETATKPKNDDKSRLTKKLLETQKSLLSLICFRKDLYLKCKGTLRVDDFWGDVCQNAARVIYDMWDGGLTPAPAEVLSRLPAEVSCEAADIFFKPHTYSDYDLAFSSLVKSMANEKLTIEIQQESDIMKKNELIKEQIKLRKGDFYEYQ